MAYKDPEKKRDYNRRYHQAHAVDPEKRRAGERRRYEADPEKARAGNRAKSHRYRQRHLDKVRAYYRDYYYGHREKMQAYSHDYQKTHAEERRAGDRRRYQADPAKVRARSRLSKHGVTAARFQEMWTAQDGLCANAACGRSLAATERSSLVRRRRGPAVYRLENDCHIDHDHGCCPGSRSCGRCVRGLLCRFCNSAAGLLGDDPARLRGLADYLEREPKHEPWEGSIPMEAADVDDEDAPASAQLRLFQGGLGEIHTEAVFQATQRAAATITAPPVTALPLAC